MKSFSVYYQQASAYLFHSTHQSLEAAELTAYHLEAQGYADVSISDDTFAISDETAGY